jgi:hypothetical protein
MPALSSDISLAFLPQIVGQGALLVAVGLELALGVSLIDRLRTHSATGRRECILAVASMMLTAVGLACLSIPALILFASLFALVAVVERITYRVGLHIAPVRRWMLAE